MFDLGISKQGSILWNKSPRKRRHVREELQFNLTKTQWRMKYYADKYQKKILFQEGELLFLKLNPYKQRSLASKINEKHAWRYYGPYKVVKRVGNFSYRLELPNTCSIHPILYVSQLKKELTLHYFTTHHRRYAMLPTTRRSLTGSSSRYDSS